jgi:hypothetical protein
MEIPYRNGSSPSFWQVHLREAAIASCRQFGRNLGIYYRCTLLPFLKIPLFKRSIYVFSKSNEYIGKYCLLSFINKEVIIMNV